MLKALFAGKSSLPLPRRLLRFVTCILLGAAVAWPVLPCLAAGAAHFVRAGSLITPRDSQRATLLLDGRVLVEGGFDQQSQILASAELYNSKTRAWSVTGSMASARAGHTATLLPNGMVLVAGGGQFPVLVSTAELYSPSAGAWSVTAPPIIPKRIGASATLLTTSKVLLAGGF